MARVCNCGGVVRDGECSRCANVKRMKQPENRPTSNERGYTYQWSKMSKAVRKERPLCEDCLDHQRVRPSEEVHHIQKVSEYPELQYVMSNLMALCGRCHKIRTARGE